MTSILQGELLRRSEAILKFKREHLSLLTDNDPLFRFCVRDTSELIQQLDARELPPARSNGFCDMSEIWLAGDFGGSAHELDQYVQPFFGTIRFITAQLLGQPTMIFKAVIDTITEDSCILPHTDDYFHHAVALRVHVVLRTSPGSIGLSWHPENLASATWHMEQGGVYAINNFEPHTVTKLDAGPRSHLICDVVVANLFRGFKEAQLKSELMGLNANLVTPGRGNFELRNALAIQAGVPTCSALRDQVMPANVALTKAWVQALASRASEQHRTV